MAEDYNPYEFRQVEHPMSYFEILAHLLKGSLGTGILAMPRAFMHSGYGVGLCSTILIGILCAYNMNLLINAQYELCMRTQQPSLTYPETVKLAFEEGPAFFKKLAPSMTRTINLFLVILQLGIACVYTVFIADNVKNVADQYVKPIKIQWIILMLLLPLILINYVRNLKHLAPLSLFANAVTLLCYGIITYYIIDKGMTFDDRKPIGVLLEYPLFLGAVLFSLEAVGVVMPLENEMEYPEKFRGWFGVLNIAMFVITVLYTLFGFCGYLAYGADSKPSITINIDETEILAQVAKLMLALAMYITHSLQTFIAFDIIWNQSLKEKLKNKKCITFYEYICRTLIVAVTVGLAVLIPYLEYFITFAGSFCLSILGIALPAMTNMSTYWYNIRGCRKGLWICKNVIIIIIGLLALIVGTGVTIVELTWQIEQDNS